MLGDPLIGLFGGGNSSQKLPFATVMKSCQICAGNVPPATEMPWTLRIARSAFG